MNRTKLTAIVLGVTMLLGAFSFMVYSTVRTIQNWGVDPASEYRQELETVNADNVALNVLINQYRVKINELTALLENTKDDFEQQIIELTESHETQRTALQSTISGLNITIANLGNDLLTERATVLALSNQVGNLNDQLSFTNTELTAVRSLNAGLNNNVQSLQNIISGLQLVIASHELTQAQGSLIVNGLETQVFVLTAQVANLMALNANFASQIAGLNTLIATLELIIEASPDDDKIGLLTAQVHDLQAQLVLVNAQMEFNDWLLMSMYDQISDLNVIIMEMNALLAETWNTADERLAMINELTAQVESLNATVTTNLATIQSLQSQVETLQAELTLAQAPQVWHTVLFALPNNVANIMFFTIQTVRHGNVANPVGGNPPRTLNLPANFEFAGWALYGTTEVVHIPTIVITQTTVFVPIWRPTGAL